MTQLCHLREIPEMADYPPLVCKSLRWQKPAISGKSLRWQNPPHQVARPGDSGEQLSIARREKILVGERNFG